MRAKLRTWMRSGRVWVTIGCLVYIGLMDLGLIYGQWPRIAAIWPRGVWVAIGLGSLAAVFVSVIAYDVVVLLCTRLGVKKFDGRTDKAKEKFADSLMSVSNAIHSAAWISVLVFPLTAFIQAMTKGTDPVAVVVSWWPPAWWSEWHTAVLIGLYFLPIIMSVLFRGVALNIYDKLSPPVPAVTPTVQGTPERPNVPAEVKTTPANANGGSRRRRRHRRT